MSISELKRDERGGALPCPKVQLTKGMLEDDTTNKEAALVDDELASIPIQSFAGKDNWMTIDTEFFKRVMGHFLTGVTVVTTRSQDKIAGITVSAFCSLSLDPPLVLVCIDLNSATLPLLRESKIFAVNMLSAKQEHLSRGFAMNTQERFEHFCHASSHTAVTGAPIIDGTLGFIDARIVAEYPGGDHVILIGAVEALGTGDQVDFTNTMMEVAQNGSLPAEKEHPLAYYQGQYRHLASHYHQPSLPAYKDDLERQIG